MKMVGKKKIVIVHHQPLEMFPPVMNFINYVSTRIHSNNKVHVLTSSAHLGVKKFENNEVSIKRIYKASRRGSRLRLLYNYGMFTLTSLYDLIKLRPDVILYYESHSALPVFLYYKYFKSGAKLFIHYHEYMTPAEYSQKGMRLVNFSHKKEHYLFKLANWISHTNPERMELFKQDNKLTRNEVCFVLPNYPPARWASNPSLSDNITLPVKMAYVGSFGSTEDLYIEEILNWVKLKPDELQLDIYSFNTNKKVVDFILRLNAENIRLFDAVDYDDLPSVLLGYNIGLILYKGTTLNFKFNAPNKLFEYLAIGMDVWFPKEMLGCYPYVRSNVYPKIIDVDFKRLTDFDYKKVINRDGLDAKKSEFFCETAYAPLLEKMQQC